MASEARFSLFPVAGLQAADARWSAGAGEISFSGKVENYCVCFIDMVGSTKVSRDLSPGQLSRYYEIFLNAIALIARNFGARVVKNAGDALIFYFEGTSDPAHTAKFRDVLECGLTMGTASRPLNARMLSEGLPPVQYRISADYGPVSVARSQSSQAEDLFGPAMNNCAKINALARPNGLVIGQGLYEVVRNLEGYRYSPAAEGSYSGFHVEATQARETIDPFEKRSG